MSNEGVGAGLNHALTEFHSQYERPEDPFAQENYMHALMYVATNYLAEHPELHDRAAEIESRIIATPLHIEVPSAPMTDSLKYDQLELSTDSGVVLNNLLPPGVNIISNREYSPGYDPENKRIVVSNESLNMGPLTNVVLAHEFGHALTPNIDEVVNSKKRIVESTDRDDTTLDEYLDAFVRYMNLVLQLEKEGYDYGKHVADILGVSELYEGTQGVLFRHYIETQSSLALFRTLGAQALMNNYPPEHLDFGEDFLTKLQADGLDTSKVLRVYNPVTDEYNQTTVGEFLTKASKVDVDEENSRVSFYKQGFKRR